MNLGKRGKLVVKTILEKKVVLLDGAMGTMLQASGLALGERPETLNLTNPSLIEEIHKAYCSVGSGIVYANTFGANAHKLTGMGYEVEEVIAAGVGIAKKACQGFETIVALDVGPIGELLEPSGTLTFEEAYDVFAQVVTAGEKAGADLIIFETMTDLYEVKAAVLAAKELTNLPVFVTMTFEENGRTFTGCGIEQMAIVLQGLGVDAMGINCSLGPVEILPLMKRLSKATPLPLIAKPNAGLPDPETGEYSIFAQEFGALMKEYVAAGIKFIGGCCGTTKDYIQCMSEEIQGVTVGERTYNPQTRVCTPTELVTVDRVRVIGERLNPTGKKRFANALQTKDMSYILGQALEQVSAGAHILDLNVGVPGLEEAPLMAEMVKAIQGVVSVPLQIDSSHIDALEAGLRVYNGKAILNSVNGEEENLAKILPIAKKYGAVVLGLTIDQEGVPKTAQKRVEIARRIVDSALAIGIPKEDIVIDCLTLTVSAQQADCMETLHAMAMIKEELGVQLALGVSNISFGLPNRGLLNHTFLTVAMSYGLTLPILNPNAKPMMDAVNAFSVLAGHDIDALSYIERFSEVATEEKPQMQKTMDADVTLEYAIVKGLSEEVTHLTKEMICVKEPLEIVNTYLIPTLDLVGKKYENGEFFLPQLMRSANASCKAFDVIKEHLAKTNQDSISKGTILLATVKGDIHDIGKNIVKVILENYGYEVIDLGKDVSPQLIVDTAIEKNIQLVGLSALMTTTVESMKETIKLIKTSGHKCKVVVGGAVLTPTYAEKIGADYYAKDAKQGIDVAKEVFG